MRKDPILEELRAIRAQISKECHDDLGEMVAYFQKKSREAGLKTVTLVRKRSGASKARQTGQTATRIRLPEKPVRRARRRAR